VTINGHELAGGVPGAPSSGEMPMWGTRLLIIDPGVLRDENILRMESKDFWAGTPWASNNLDDFTIDNVVVFFKLRSGKSNTGDVKL
jgi:hypothetical protein